jgi:uncharacterized protein (DUF302 family)
LNIGPRGCACLNSQETTMPLSLKKILSAAALAATLCVTTLGGDGPAFASETVAANGIVKVKSAYPMPETIDRLKADVADKGIMLFAVINQADLAAKANIVLRPSTLLIFGNPGLGANFMTSNPESGIDWPVRLLVYQDAEGGVWAEYTDFGWIARRHGITDREAEFAMATKVVDSITSTVRQD